MLHRSRLCRVLVLTTAALLLPIAPAVAAAAPTPTPSPAPQSVSTDQAPPSKPGTVTFGVAPGTASGPDGRTAFTYNRVAAGSVVEDYVGISNFSDQPETFSMGAADAYTLPNGSLTLNEDNVRSVDMGSWVSFDHTQITIPAHARLNEPFKVTVPANAKPGDHNGGVFAEYRIGAGTGKSNGVSQDHRVAVLLYLSVPGTVTTGLTVGGLSTGYDGSLNPVGGGTAHVSYTITNTGNVNMSGTQNIAIKGLYGITLASIKGPAVPELLPGQSYKVKVKLSGVFPLGWMSTKVSITPKQTHPNSAGPSPTSISKVTKSAGFWGTPVLLLVLIVLIVLGVWGGRKYFRYRDNAREDALYEAVERARRETADQLTSTSPGDAGSDRGTEKPSNGA